MCVIKSECTLVNYIITENSVIRNKNKKLEGDNIDMNNKISVVAPDDCTFKKDDEVTVYYSPNFMLLTKKQECSNVNYVKLSKNEYLNTVTGDVRITENKMLDYRSYESLRKTFFKLSLLINSNFFGGESESFITLSYNRKIEDDSYVSKDIKNFWAKLGRFVKTPKLYRGVFLIEYQCNGQPHIHVLLKRLDYKKISLTKKDVCSLWGNGTVDIQSIYDIDGLIKYLSPFHNHKKIKRLHFYKPYQKVYRCKGDFNRPNKFKSTFEESLALAKVNNLKECEKDSYEVINANNDVVNVIKKLKFRGENYK